jgi:hypothetical protein
MNSVTPLKVLDDCPRPIASILQRNCTVRVFRQRFTLEDAIGSHACDQWHSSRVLSFLPIHTVNCVQTLKALFTFGTGLSYTDFSLTCHQTTRVGSGVGAAKSFTFTCSVTNTGRLHGDEVVQVFHSVSATIKAAAKHPVHGARFFGRNIHSRMPLDPTHVRLKRPYV